MYVFTKKHQLRANTTVEWEIPDTPEALAKHDRYTPYGVGDIEYRFNEHGFRCDSFYEEAELPVLFLGCSHTMGIGLPLQDVWTYRLLEKIRSATGKKIPYWSLGTGGFGIDTVAASAYWFLNTINVKPAITITLIPDLMRREIAYYDLEPMSWLPGFETWYPIDTNLKHVVADERFNLLQSHRSLRMLDLCLRLFGSKNVTSYCEWGFTTLDNEKPLNDYPALNIFDPPPIPKQVDFARDGAHWGPTYNATLAQAFWEKLEPEFGAPGEIRTPDPTGRSCPL